MKNFESFVEEIEDKLVMLRLVSDDNIEVYRDSKKDIQTLTIYIGFNFERINSIHILYKKKGIHSATRIIYGIRNESCSMLTHNKFVAKIGSWIDQEIQKY